MHSMSEAMKAALEHPMEEAPHKPRVAWTPKAVPRTDDDAGSVWWGLAVIVGSISVAAATLILRGKRNAASELRRAEALGAMDFGGD
ncbi:MAG: hypothetical protein ABIR70_06385 [Bryobacteraceae bacterium]